LDKSNQVAAEFRQAPRVEAYSTTNGVICSNNYYDLSEIMSTLETIEFRPASAEELPKFTELMKYAFLDEPDEKDTPIMIPDWTLCAFDGDTMAASSAVLPFTMRFNGSPVAAAGITGVVTNPGYRRKGLVRELMTRTLLKEHRKNTPVAILWASMGAIYQRFGYGLASNHVRYCVDPRLATFQEQSSSSDQTRLCSRNDGLPVIKEIYRQYCADRHLLLHRSDIMWDSMLPEKGPGKYHIAVTSDKNGKPRAYCLYKLAQGPRTDSGPDQHLRVIDFAWLDLKSYRTTWNYLCAHDLVNQVEWIAVPEDDPAPGLLLEPRNLNRKISDGIWMRVIDAEATLSSRLYDTEGDLVIQIKEDALCPWNIGYYQIQSDGIELEVRKLSQPASADLETSINGLASLVSGYGKASWLDRIGRLKICSTHRRAALDNFFSTRYRPTCANDF
jgi:predicted acetyltransferase